MPGGAGVRALDDLLDRAGRRHPRRGGGRPAARLLAPALLRGQAGAAPLAHLPRVQVILLRLLPSSSLILM